MTQTVANALTAIAAKVATVSGINTAPAYPPETIGETTFAIPFVLDGTMDSANAGASETFLNIAIDVLTVRNDLASDMARLAVFLDSIPLALLAEVRGTEDQFSNTIETFRGLAIEYLPSVDYAGVQCVGYRFTMQGVKFLVEL